MFLFLTLAVLEALPYVFCSPGFLADCPAQFKVTTTENWVPVLVPYVSGGSWPSCPGSPTLQCRPLSPMWWQGGVLVPLSQGRSSAQSPLCPSPHPGTGSRCGCPTVTPRGFAAFLLILATSLSALSNCTVIAQSGYPHMRIPISINPAELPPAPPTGCSLSGLCTFAKRVRS